MSLSNAVAAIVYVSEGANPAVLSALREAAVEACRAASSTTRTEDQFRREKSKSAAFLVHSFADPVYNRTSFVLCGSPLPVATAASALTHAAVSALPDLRLHSATHPRIGLVDHVSVSPLCVVAETRASLQPSPLVGPGESCLNLGDAVEAALALARGLQRTAAAKEEGAATATSQGASSVPVLLYGAAHPAGRTLAETRRATPYFAPAAAPAACSPAAEGGDGTDWAAGWAGVVPDVVPGDLGRSNGRAGKACAVDPAVGVCCVGATPLVVNFNVRLDTTERAVALAATRAVRTRRGGKRKAGTPSSPSTSVPSAAALAASAAADEYESGLPLVEALALKHQGGCYEVACNLLDTAVTDPEAVLRRVECVASAAGCGVEASYVVGLTVEQIRTKLEEALKSAAIAAEPTEPAEPARREK